MSDEKKRSDAQKRTEIKHDAKRASLPRFGGRCSEEQKKQITTLAKLHNCDEKTIVFKALDFFEKNYSK